MRWSIASPLALFDFVKDAAGDRCYIGFYNSGSDYRINIPDTGLFSSGVLGNWRIEWDTGGTHLYLNNSSVGTIGVAQTIPTGFESLYIGAYTDGSGSASGEISDLGQWNRRLSTDEEFILEATGCPLHVPLGLVRYSPIIGRHSPEIDLVGGENLTLTGTPAAASHPRIFLPYAQSDYFVAGALTHYSLTADVGAFTETGQAANLLYGRKLTSDVGAFALAGQAANLLYARLLAADVGAFTLAGQDAGLLKGKTLTADVGTFALAGQDVAFRTGYALTANTGVFTESGQAADLRTTKILSAAHGSFTLSGQDATLTAAGVVTIPSGRLFRVSRETRIFRVPPQ